MPRIDGLSGQAKMIAETIDDITDKYDHEYWVERAEENVPAEELWETLIDQGFAGINVPEEYGGTDLNMYHTAILLERMTSNGVFEGNVVSTGTMAPIPIKQNGDDALKERFLPRIAAGDATFAFGITEPHSGTNSYKIRTQARRDGDEYVIDGQKTYMSLAASVDYILLVTRTQPYEAVKDGDRSDGITLLIVDTDADGIDMDPMDLKITQSENQYNVFFEEVRVPADNRISAEGEGFKALFGALNPERICVSAMATGFGRFALQRGVEYAKERQIWDEPLGSHQGVQHPLSEAKVDLELAAMAMERAAKRFDQGAPNAGAFANMAKFAASEAANEAVDTAIQVHGGAGFSREYGVINVRNYVRHFRVGPVNNEMILNYIGENVLGLPKSY